MTALETGSDRAPSAAALRRARRFRLPSTTRPTDVDLHLEIDPDKSQRFSGQLRVGLSLARGTRTLVLHAAGLEITEPQIETGGERLAGQITLDPLREIVRIRFPRTLARGEARLELNFSGPLRDDLMGLHRIDTTGRRFVFSQLCTTRARNVFPCFDEPGFKARYQVSITTAAGHEVISNMPAERKEPGRGGRATVHFERTPPLSTYLLAVAVGELEISRSVYAGKTEIRVITTPGKTRLADLALEVAERALPLLERWFELPYPYPKLDLVAVPQFSFGAMENAGAVFFRETLLLADPAQASFEERKRLTETVCHELAHMWFGDLVTMAWWDDLWLNESFATWMAFHAVDELYPELSSWQAFQHRKDAALDLDALEHTHPVYMPVASAEEADENFDLITYEKGASVIRMLAGFLGPEMFQQGVRKYIKTHAEGNATAADLWAALESVSDVPVARIMRAWIEQSGHPHVRVSRGNRNGRVGVILEQSLHRTVSSGAGGDAEGDPLRWPVPWIGHAGSNRDGTPRLVKHIVEKKSDFVEVDDAPWVYGNGEEAGFYRTWHDEHEDALLRAALDDLSTTERQGYVGHQWALVQAGLVPVGSLLALVERLGGEEDADVLQAVETPLAALGRGLVQDLSEATVIGYREWIVASFGPALDAIGTAPRKRDSEALRRRRAQLLGLVAVSGQSPSHGLEARAIAMRVLTGRHDIDPELVSAWLMAAARDGDAALHDAFADSIRRAPTPQERQRALFALAEFGAPALVDRTLEWCVTDRVSNQDLVFVLGRCLAQPTAQKRTWAFIQERWDELSKVLPPYHASRLIAATTHLRSTRHQREVIRFFKGLSLPSTRRALQQARERFAGHARLKDHAGADLEAWVRGER